MLSVSWIAELLTETRFPFSTAPLTRNDPQALEKKQQARTAHQQNLSSERRASYLAASIDPSPYCHYDHPSTEDIVEAHVTRIESYLAKFDEIMSPSGG